MSNPSPLRPCGGDVHLRVIIMLVAFALAFLVLWDVVESGWTWGRVLGLLPAVAVSIYLQFRFDIVGPPNVRKDK